ncbi:GNAT family N-acetyltransferase [Nocardioides caldifontis]|uniref:GNAT family N-acetyltransferase n=1 Tax=Nocardioides caldifontis TaxID=2588938 RepID=UPI0011DFD9B0|nr:GNAT family N-acetyltransferase [Nocardioides caldifontis]
MPFSLRPVDPAADAPLLHRRVVADRAEFWGMQDASVDDVAAIYGWIQEQPHLAAYLVESAADRPLALLQTYDPAVDEIGAFYERRPGDLGVHLLLSDDPDRAGRTAELVSFVLAWLFSDATVTRLVFEPDVRNEKSRALLARIGAVEGPQARITTEHSEKEAQFYFLLRQDAPARP